MPKKRRTVKKVSAKQPSYINMVKQLGYDSVTEHLMHTGEILRPSNDPQTKAHQQRLCGILKGCVRNKQKYPYVIEKSYTPDFTHPREPNVLLEVKGVFRDSSEAAKYVHWQKQYPEMRLIFIFEKPHTPLPWRKKPRKNGTRMTHAEWATLHKFEWYCPKTIPTRFSV